MDMSVGATVFLFLLIVGVLIFMGIVFGCFFTVNQAQRGIVEKFNKYSRTANPGLSFKLPFIENVVKLSMKVIELEAKIDTKTKDNVFVRTVVSIQYRILEDRVRDAYYKLSDPANQIESYVNNLILGHIPKLTLDETFEQKDTIALQVKTELGETMSNYGYAIVTVLVTDIIPDAKVVEAMNHINAAQREQVAAQATGEANKILAIKNAEAEKETKILQGQGIAGERQAIIDGLKKSIQDLKESVPGATAEDAMAMVLTTQYFDTLAKIGSSDRTNTIFLPHSPGGLSDIRNQIREAIISGATVTKSIQDTPVTPRPPTGS